MKLLSIALTLACSLHAGVRPADFGERALMPGPQIASGQDSWSLFANPAGLAYVQGANLVGGYSYHWKNPTDLHLAAASAAFNLFEGFSIGLGLQAQQDLINGQLALAYRFGRAFSLGLWAFKQRQYHLNSSDPFLLGLGAQYYPAQWLSLGFLTKQNTGDFIAPLEFDLGASIRPFGRQFNVFAETRFFPKSDRWSNGYDYDFLTGLRLDLEGFSLIGTAVIQKNPLFMFGVDIGFDHFGFGPIGGNDFAGARFNLTSESGSSLAPKRNQWVRLDLSANGVPENRIVSLSDRLFKKPVSPLLFLDALDKLVKDSTIQGVFMTIDGLNFGFGKAEELRDTLIALKNSDKQVVVYLENPNPTDYYVATAAHKIYLNPAGMLSLDRFQRTLVYFKKALDELGVEAEVISAGAYKSAPRPLIANAPNAQELEVTNALLDEQYAHFIQAICQKTQKTPEEVKSRINLGILTSQEALSYGLIDAVAFNDQPEELKFSYRSIQQMRQPATWGTPDEIAIIPITGTIIKGRSSPSFWFPRVETGSDDVVESIQAATSNPRVKGILVRIDSPGGSAFGSDQIYRALLEARQKKPVIASMGDMAASGGYYAAAGTHEIWAEPSTLTGSIGVFTLRLSAQKLFSKLGVSSFELKRGSLPGPTLFRPLSPAERERGQLLVDWDYRRFKQAVAQGQNLDFDVVSKLAEGRVWTGEQAHANKLVQNLGGFSQALAQVKNLSGIQAGQEIQLKVYQSSNWYSFNLNPMANLQALASLTEHSLALMPYFL